MDQGQRAIRPSRDERLERATGAKDHRRGQNRRILSGFRSPFASAGPRGCDVISSLPGNKKGALADAHRFCGPSALGPSDPAYWQASQVPPLRMASIEQAFFSSAVYSFFFSALGAFSTVAFSMLEAPRVRR